MDGNESKPELSPQQLTTFCRSLAPEILERLRAQALSDDWRESQGAAKILLAYGYGLPSAQLLVEARVLAPEEVLPEAEVAELRAMYREKLRAHKMQGPTLQRVK